MPTSYTLTATERKASANLVAGKGEGSSLKVLLVSTVEFTAGATARTVDFGEIPSNARIAACSRVYNDDCATTGAPTMDFGLSSADITADDDAIGDSAATLATATNVGYQLITDPVRIGKRAWELVNGQTTDPKGHLTVYGTQKDASTTQTGTITVEILGYLD